MSREFEDALSDVLIRVDALQQRVNGDPTQYPPLAADRLQTAFYKLRDVYYASRHYTAKAVAKTYQPPPPDSQNGSG